MTDRPAFKIGLGLGMAKRKTYEALTGRRVEFFGSVDEDDVLLFGVDDVLDHHADVDYL